MCSIDNKSFFGYSLEQKLANYINLTGIEPKVERTASIPKTVGHFKL